VRGKGGKVVLIPLPPAVGRAIDRAVGDRDDGPILRNTLGGRMDRHAATRRLKHLAATVGLSRWQAAVLPGLLGRHRDRLGQKGNHGADPAPVALRRRVIIGPMSGGSYIYLVVDEEWPEAQSALATARHIVASCGTFVSLGLRWRTSRLDAVERARPLLDTAAGFAEFTTHNPDRLIAAIVTAGTASNEPAVAGAEKILEYYDRILDALAHTPLAESTELEIEFDHEPVDGSAVVIAEPLVDKIVALAADDQVEAYWTCAWFDNPDSYYCGVGFELNGEFVMSDGYRPGELRVTVSIFTRLDDIDALVGRIQDTAGVELRFDRID
jgi:hypothetical protein